MSLQTRRPPGHGKRKALSYSAEILRLRAAGHSMSAIREALEDAGVVVSVSTVRREVLKAASAPAVVPATARSPSLRAAVAPARAAGPDVAGSAALPGRDVAEEFMRGRPTNTLILKETSK